VEAAVNDLGLNRFRLEIGPQVEMLNDNSDPWKTNYNAFRFKWQDFLVHKWLIPLTKSIEQRGERTILYVSYDLRSSLTPEWLLQPQEYAEMAVTTLSHLERTQNIEVNYWSVLNEPGNKRPGNPQLVAQLISHTGKRIKESGFITRMSGPEVVTPDQITKYMKALYETTGALAQMGQLTYHLYWDPMNIARRREIRDWAERLNVTTAQTEWLEGEGLNVAEVLYLDLTEANVSAWEQYGLCWTANRYNIDGGGDYFIINPEYTGYYVNDNTWYLRQFMKFVRPGDVRVAVYSSNPSIKPTGFRKPDGRHTLVIINSSKRNMAVQINNLQAGKYSVVETNPSNKGSILPQQSVTAGKTLDFEISANAVVTFFALENL
jgi:hypothetical protein